MRDEFGFSGPTGPPDFNKGNANSNRNRSNPRGGPDNMGTDADLSNSPDNPIGADEVEQLERAVHPSESSDELALRIFQENAPLAARAITTLALNGSSERVRLDASKYITDRVFGRIGDPKADDNVGASWENLIAEAVTNQTVDEATAYAEAASRSHTPSVPSVPSTPNVPGTSTQQEGDE